MFENIRGMFEEISENVQEDSGKCSKRLRRMFKTIPGNVREDSGECSRRFQEKLKKISGNLNLDLFCENLAYFLSNSAIKMRKNKGIFSALLITTYN